MSCLWWLMRCSLLFCRFYLMRLKNTSWQFEAITHHANTTQCLGSLHGLPWYWFVGRSTIVGATERVDPEKRSQVLKAPGYEYLPPAVEDIRLFRVDGSRFLKLHVGTWHARPLFKEPFMEFYNLELSNTNVSFYCSCIPHYVHLYSAKPVVSYFYLYLCTILRLKLPS